MEEELFFDGTLQQIASISEIFFLQNVIVYFGLFFFSGLHTAYTEMF